PRRDGTLTGSPVLGLRPLRGWRAFTRNVPKFEMTTLSPWLSEARIVSNVVSTARAASPFVVRTFATALMMSRRFIWSLPLLAVAHVDPRVERVLLDVADDDLLDLEAELLNGGEQEVVGQRPGQDDAGEADRDGLALGDADPDGQQPAAGEFLQENDALVDR